MATFKLNKKGIASLEAMLKRRVNAVKCRTASQAYTFLAGFQYHANNGPGQGGYTLLYAANWNCSIRSPDIAVNGYDRGYVSTFNPEGWGSPGEFSSLMDPSKADRIFSTNKIEVTDEVYVCNSVSYGRDLNEGNNWWSFREGSQLKIGTEPNRFIELCEEFLRDNVKTIVASIRNEVK